MSTLLVVPSSSALWSSTYLILASEVSYTLHIMDKKRSSIELRRKQMLLTGQYSTVTASMRFWTSRPAAALLLHAICMFMSVLGVSYLGTHQLALIITSYTTMS